MVRVHQQSILHRSQNLPQTVLSLVSRWPRSNDVEKTDMLIQMSETFGLSFNCSRCVTSINSAIDQPNISENIRKEISTLTQSVGEIKKIVAKTFDISTLLEYIKNKNINIAIIPSAVRGNDSLKVRINSRVYNTSGSDLLTMLFEEIVREEI